VFVSHNLEVAKTVELVGTVAMRQGRYFEASEAYNLSFQMRVLHFRGTAAPLQHVEMAYSFECLGNLFREQGNILEHKYLLLSD
jgi:hypothetical protein